MANTANTNDASSGTWKQRFAQVLQLSVALFAVGAAAFGVLLVAPGFSGAIAWKAFTEANVGALIAALLFTSLSVQSALEAFVSNFRDLEKVKLQLEIDRCSQQLDQLRGEETPAADAGGETSTTRAGTGARASEKEKQEQRLQEAKLTLERCRATTKQLVNVLALFVGAAVSLAGVRVLQPFVAAMPLAPSQATLFNAIDILLTAGSISGGSDGIHQLAVVYKSLTESATQVSSAAARNRT